MERHGRQERRLRGAVAASHGALDRSGQAGVDPIARQIEAAHRRARRPAAAAGPAPAKRWRAARGSTVPRSSRASRACGSAAVSSACAAAMSSAFVHRSTSAAPLDTRDRCDAVSPTTMRLSNTHCITRPGRPTNGSSSTGRSNHRLTVTIGDARGRARGVKRRLQRMRRRPRTGPPGANHGTAHTMTGGAPGLGACRSRIRRRRRPTRIRAVAPVVTVPPRRFDVLARRLRVHLVQRPGRQHDRGRPGACAEHLGEHAGKRRGGGRSRPAGSARRAPADARASRAGGASGRASTSHASTVVRRGRGSRVARCRTTGAARHARAATRRSRQPSAAQSRTPAAR